MNYVEIGKRIRKFRKQQGYTQEALAEAADLSASYLSHVERGKKNISLSALFQISDALNITAAHLLIDSLPPDASIPCSENHGASDNISAQEQQFLNETIAAIRQSLRTNKFIA